MTITPSERDAVLHAIESWPIEDQVTLARAILQRATDETQQQPQSEPIRSTWDALYGIASDGQQAPSDEQVAQWLDEHKIAKYG